MQTLHPTARANVTPRQRHCAHSIRSAVDGFQSMWRRGRQITLRYSADMLAHDYLGMVCTI